MKSVRNLYILPFPQFYSACDVFPSRVRNVVFFLLNAYNAYSVFYTEHEL